MFDLGGKVALVTGGNTGIGKAVCQTLARHGADVVVDYICEPDAALALVQEIERLGRRSIAVEADVTRKDETQALMADAASRMGKIDILYNNAGHLVQRCPVAEMSEELWQRIVDVNLKTAFLCSQAVLPYMKPQGQGRIVNSASLAAHDGGGPGAAIYAAAKAGVVGFTRGLAKEYAAYGITVNAVSPGFIANTAFHNTFTKPEVQQNIVNATLLKRGGTPEDVANAVLFLASDYASYLTGELIEINGGLSFR